MTKQDDIIEENIIKAVNMFPIFTLNFARSFLKKTISVILSILIIAFPVLFPDADETIQENIQKYKESRIMSNSTSNIGFSSISAKDSRINDAGKNAVSVKSFGMSLRE